jgi:hypothetical protein
MPFFRQKTIRGLTYDLDHLDPFDFPLDTGVATRIVGVRFSCHCFTEKLAAHHTADLHYFHGAETRAFDLDRHELSKLLPNEIRNLGNRSVYLSKQEDNYFVWRQNPTAGFTGPYLIFFNVIPAKRQRIDLLMNVESAYMKPQMAVTASPVKFTTLVEFTCNGRPVPRGLPQMIKRK